MEGTAYCSTQDGINFLFHSSQIQLLFQDSLLQKRLLHEKGMNWPFFTESRPIKGNSFKSPKKALFWIPAESGEKV